MQIPQKNWLEWAVFGISLVLIVGTLGYLAYIAVSTGDTPPDLEVVLGEAQQGQFSYRIPVTVVNHGDETAEEVQVEVALTRNNVEIEQGGFTIAFLPRHAEGQGWVTFTNDPNSGTLNGRAAGYETP